jgi:hypothetical protein
MLSKFFSDLVDSLGLSTKGDFEPHARRLAQGVGASIAHLDDDSALFEFSGKLAGCTLFLGVVSSGKTIVQALSQTHWKGPPPHVAYLLAERLDKASDRISYQAKQMDSGKSRVIASAAFGPIAEIALEQFARVAADMLGHIQSADEFLEEHGYA